MWGPRFDHITRQVVLPTMIELFKGKVADLTGRENETFDLDEVRSVFESHPIHAALSTCASMRPAVDIGLTV